MTVTSSTAKVSYAGNGSTTVFAVTFRFLQNSHVQVTLRDAGGTETTWVLGTHYTLSGAGGASGTLTVKTSPTNYTPASGETLVISRNVPRTQETDYGENDNFPAETHEEALDKLTMVGQQLDETIARALVVPVSDTAADITLPIDTERASKFLAFDASGQPIAAAGTSANLTPVSAFMDTLLNDADAATARATLGAVGLSGNETIAGAKTFSSQVRFSVGATVISATNMVLGTDGNVFPVSGTATIQTITGYSAGTWFALIATGAWTIEDDGDNIKIDPSSTYTVGVGQVMTFYAHAVDKCTFMGGHTLFASSGTVAAATNNTLAVTAGRMGDHPGIKWTDMTANTTTGGSTLSFTGIGPNCSEIYIFLAGLSGTGTDEWDLLIGDSGGLETTGYAGRVLLTGSGGSGVNFTTAFQLNVAIGAGSRRLGAIYLRHRGSNLWTAESRMVSDGGSSHWDMYGTKVLSGELTQLQIKTQGSDTFDVNDGVYVSYRQ